MQTAEAIRPAGHRAGSFSTGLIHDLGKILCLFGEPQWAVVGDTFPVGCRYSERDRLPGILCRKPRSTRGPVSNRMRHLRARLWSRSVYMSWGHDEYLYHVVKDHLPEEGLAMIRYHSAYPVHRENAYMHLMNEADGAAWTGCEADQSLRPLLRRATNRPTCDKLSSAVSTKT